MHCCLLPQVRNPCYWPGEVVVATAVDVAGLRHLQDVLVFPTQGDRPLPDIMAGGVARLGLPSPGCSAEI